MPAISLTPDECLARLAAGTIGRIAVTSRALPAVVPVNYTLTGRTIVFRTERGGMLANATKEAVVAFEVDELSADGLSGWSVLAVGMAEHVDGSVVVRAIEKGLTSAAGPGRDQFVAISIGQLSGRIVEPTPATVGAWRSE